MTEKDDLRSLMHQPAEYHIRVCGRLGSEWSERFAGMSISVIAEPGHTTVSELCGRLPDQAALMGVLQQLYLYGAVLLSVTCSAYEFRGMQAPP